MTFCGIYVGASDDPEFDPGQCYMGNQPGALSPAFPPSSSHYNRDFHEWCALRGIDKIETDVSVYVAMVSKAQIIDFLAHVYDTIKSYHDPAQMLMWEGRAYLVEKLDEVRACVSALDWQKQYALVAYCD